MISKQDNRLIKISYFCINTYLRENLYFFFPYHLHAVKSEYDTAMINLSIRI